MTRRRRNLHETLDRRKPPSGREVVVPRTPKSLHPAPSSASLAPPPSGSRSSTRSAARRSGRGSSAHGDPGRPRARGRGRRSAVDLRGASRPERTSTTHKLDADAATTSMTPPAEALLLPTLCTRRDPAIPHPPAAGAAAGGRGITRTAGGEVEAQGDLRNRLPLLCGRRRPVQGRVCVRITDVPISSNLST